MAFYLYSGPAMIEWHSRSASSTLYANGIANLSSGVLNQASLTAVTSITGVLLRGSASGDIYGDYASATKIPVMIPTALTTFLCDAFASTVTTAMEGTGYDITDYNTINNAASSYKAAYIVKYLSASTALVRFVVTP